MSVKASVHELSVENKCALITLSDNGHIIIDKKNIDIKVTEDGLSMDMDWFNEMIKKRVSSSRFIRLEQNEEDII